MSRFHTKLRMGDSWTVVIVRIEPWGLAKAKGTAAPRLTAYTMNFSEGELAPGVGVSPMKCQILSIEITTMYMDKLPFEPAVLFVPPIRIHARTMETERISEPIGTKKMLVAG
jgi:hypothetical protein